MNSIWVIKPLGQKRGWRVSVYLPAKARLRSRKRVRSIIVHSGLQEATRIAKEIAAEYYSLESRPHLHKCKECWREMTREAFKGHYSCISTSCANCRDQRKRVRPALSLRLRYQVLARDNYTCQYCGRSAPIVELQVDHKIPVSKGGTYELSNLTTSCAECNLGKSDLMFDELAC